MLQITGFDACDPLSVVDDLGPGLDQRVEHDVAVEVDDRDSCQSVALLRQDPLTVESEYLRLPRNSKPD